MAGSLEEIADKIQPRIQRKEPWKALAQRFGFTIHELRTRYDPEYVPVQRHQVEDSRDVDRDGARLMAQIPSDTRSYTARMCGDPLPSRSALDQYKAENRRIPA